MLLKGCCHRYFPQARTTAGPQRALQPSCRRRAALHRRVISAKSGQERDRATVNENLGLAVTAVALTAVAGLGLTVFREDLADFVFEQSVSSAAGFGAGDLVGAALWGASMWFASPLQLLFLFLGKIDTERPSDWVLRLLGQASGQPVDAIDYIAPAPVKAVAVALFAAAGLAVAAALAAGLGDATWSVSTGLGACIAAGVYEVGRPRRLGLQEARDLEAQWRDFAAWSDARLQRSGRCHESEVFGAFRRAHARYRQQEAISDAVLRDMVRNWHPDVERTPKGFYKNLSLQPSVDPFTGQTIGSVIDAAQPKAPSEVGLAAEEARTGQ